MAQEELKYYRNGYYEIVSQDGDAVMHMYDKKAKFYIAEYEFFSGVGVCYIPREIFKAAMKVQKEHGSFSMQNVLMSGLALTKERLTMRTIREIEKYTKNMEGNFYERHYSLQFVNDYAHFVFTLLKGETIDEFFDTHGYNFFIQCYHEYIVDKLIGRQLVGRA